MKEKIIVVGSARSNGHTMQLAKVLARRTEADLLDLLDYRVYSYRYTGVYPADDDHLELIRKLLTYQHLVFASPVYWYTMSGIMKTFFDRFTDLLKQHKDLGRQLRGKQLSVLSCANDVEINASFYDAFVLSADYLGMELGQLWHGWLEEGDRPIFERQYPQGGGVVG